MKDDQYPGWISTILIDHGSANDQIVSYLTNEAIFGPRDWHMKSLIKKLNKTVTKMGNLEAKVKKSQPEVSQSYTNKHINEFESKRNIFKSFIPIYEYIN